jgi:hypothetical protein
MGYVKMMTRYASMDGAALFDAVPRNVPRHQRRSARRAVAARWALEHGCALRLRQLVALDLRALAKACLVVLGIEGVS